MNTASSAASRIESNDVFISWRWPPQLPVEAERHLEPLEHRLDVLRHRPQVAVADQVGGDQRVAAAVGAADLGRAGGLDHVGHASAAGSPWSRRR